MKRSLTLIFAVALMFVASNSFAQKFARIDSNQLLSLMPESDSAKKQLEAFMKESREAYETMNVEFNNKAADYEKKQPTLTESMKAQKEKELQELMKRIQDYPQIVQQGQEEMSQKLYTPIREKALNAIKKVGKDNGFACVLEAGATLYVDEAQITDALPMVKKELGIK